MLKQFRHHLLVLPDTKLHAKVRQAASKALKLGGVWELEGNAIPSNQLNLRGAAASKYYKKGLSYVTK